MGGSMKIQSGFIPMSSIYIFKSGSFMLKMLSYLILVFKIRRKTRAETPLGVPLVDTLCLL